MKILFNRISNRISGAEIYNLYLLEELKKFTDFELFFSSDNKPLNKRISKIGIKTLYINPHINEVGTKKQFLKALFSLNKYYFAYIKLFRSLENIDLIIFESMTEKLFLTCFLAFQGKKIVWVEHGPLFQTKRAKIIKVIYWLNSRFIKKIICVSRATEKDLNIHGISKKKTISIYIGVNPNKFYPLTVSEKNKVKFNLFRNTQRIIGFLGTVTKEKGIDVFLDVAVLLCKMRKDIKFVIIGGGDLLQWMKNETEKRNISSMFYFTNELKDVRRVLGTFDVLLFPTTHIEGLSMALLEATSMGVPIVARDIGGNREIVRNYVNGILYKNSSINEIIKDIEKIFSQNKKYSTMARNTIINDFTLEKSAKSFYTLFRNLLYER